METRKIESLPNSLLKTLLNSLEKQLVIARALGDDRQVELLENGIGHIVAKLELYQ